MNDYKVMRHDNQCCSSPVGSRLRKEFTLSPDGKKLVQSGVHDQFELIQSHRASCDIKMIFERLDLGGSPQDLLKRYIEDPNFASHIDSQGVYLDFPNEISNMDVSNAIARSRALYESRADLQSQFGSFESFVDAFGYSAADNEVFNRKEVKSDEVAQTE